MNILSWPLRSLLLVGSAAVFLVITSSIKKRKIQLKDGIFWLGFSFLLVMISAFPTLAFRLSELMGVQSPSNCVFLVVIFLLVCHEFILTIRVSQLEMKNARLIQKMAIDQMLDAEEKQDEKENLLLFR